MTKLNTALIDRLVAAGGLVVKKQAPQPTRSWHDDPDDRDREIRQYEPDDIEYWHKYLIVFNGRTEALAGINFYGLPSVRYNARFDEWSCDFSDHDDEVIAAVRARLQA